MTCLCRYSGVGGGINPTDSQTSALEGVGGERHAPVALSRERAGTHYTRGSARLGAGQDGHGKSCPGYIRSPDREARSESL